MAILPVSMQIFISNPFIELRQPPETNIQNRKTLKANVLIMEKLRTRGQDGS